MNTLDKLLSDNGKVADLAPEQLVQAFSTVRSTATNRIPRHAAVSFVARPRRGFVARVGLGVAATVAIAATGVLAANLTSWFGPDRGTELVAGQDGNHASSPDVDDGEEGAGPVLDERFAAISPGFYEEDGKIVWRIYADATAPDVDAPMVPSQFTSAELDAIYVQLEELAARELNQGEFFTHDYDAKTDTVRIVGNIPLDRLPADLFATNILSYEFTAVETRQSPDVEPGEDELPTLDN